MNARVCLCCLFIAALTLSACGPSPAEQAATATQGAENIFATLTAQAPTPTATFTPSPTPTATPTSTPTPTPTSTPLPSPTPTPGISSLALTLDDLPDGFSELPEAQLQHMEESYPRGSSAFGFQEQTGTQVITGVLVPYETRTEQAIFDSTQPQIVDAMATVIGSGSDPEPLAGIDDLGESREGITTTSDVFNVLFRWDILAFRRNEVGVIMFIGYPDQDGPDKPIAELASVLDERIQIYTAGGEAVSRASGADTIKIGLISPLTGQVPTFGQSVLEGVQIAVDEWNLRGGILGKQIELVVTDGQCSADPAKRAADKLINQDGVKYIIGEVCSSASIPVSEIVNQKKVVQISPTSTNLAVTVDGNGNTKPFTFRACFIDPFQGLVMAKFAHGEGYRTAFIMYDPGNDYTVSLAESFEKSFTQLGGRILGKATYRSTDTDFADILTSVAESEAEVLYLPDYYNIVNLVGAQAKDQGLSAVLMGGDGWDSADLDVTAADGGFYSNHYDPGDTRPIVADWNERYGAEFKDVNGDPKVPDALATLAYDAANLLFTAIDEAGVDDPTRVAEVLAGLTLEGVSGTITFDAQHNPLKNAVVIGVAGGKKTFVESILP